MLAKKWNHASSALVLSLWALALGGGLPSFAQAQDYKYNPSNKVDPFQSVTLRKPTIRGLSRLQDYDVSELELVGTVLGEEISALILTPDPREGILAKIGDRAGKKGGRILAIARNKVVVREPVQGAVLPGKNQKFVDVVMLLSSRSEEGASSPGSSSAAAGLQVPGSSAQNSPSSEQGVLTPPSDFSPEAPPPGFAPPPELSPASPPIPR